MNETTWSLAESTIGQREQGMRSEKVSHTQDLTQAQQQAFEKLEADPVHDGTDEVCTVAHLMASQDTLQRAQRGISRRTVLRWTGLAVVGVAGGGLLLSACSKQPGVSPASTPSPTPLPVGTTLYTYRGHSSGVGVVAWSPDGKRIASGSADNTVQVWNATDGGNVFTYPGHTDSVPSVAWSPDGKRIASGGADVTVQVWDATTGGHVYTYGGHANAVEAVAWSPDGKRIASGGDDKTVQVWDATSGGHVYTYRGHSDWVTAVAWSPDGKRIASGGIDHTVQVWQAV